MARVSSVLAMASITAVAASGVADDRFPMFHTRPATNWMNDPNGPMYMPSADGAGKGVYHLFTQYNPFGSAWGNMSWSHMASHDLVQWWHLPVALRPNNTYDADGVFSGSATLVNGLPVISYTCVSKEGQRQCLARPADASDPNLVAWVKDAGNPVIAQQPPGAPTGSFRDPTTAWRDGDVWRMAVGTSISGVGHVAQYTSSDFEAWKLEGFMYQDSTGQHSMFECPDFFAVNASGGPGSTWVVKISSHGDWYALGDYDEASQRLVPRTQLRRYVAGPFYASKRFHDGPRERQTLYGWVQESSGTTKARGWQGSQSLPLQVTWSPAHDALAIFPIPELQALRNATLAKESNVALPPGADTAVAGATGLMLEARASFALPSAAESAWRRCVDARWTPAASASPFDVTAACDGAVGSLTPARFGLAVRATTGGEIQTRVGVRAVPQTGPLNNTDMPGGDYRDYGLPAAAGAAANIANCSGTCAAEPECVAWTYVRQGGPSAGKYPVPRCSLKSSVPAPAANQWCVSGTPASLQLEVDQSRSGGDGDHSTITMTVPVAASDSTVDLAVFVDRSVIESYVNGGLARVVSRSYPDASAGGVRLFNAGNATVTASDVTVYSMDQIWIANPYASA